MFEPGVIEVPLTTRSLKVFVPTPVIATVPLNVVVPLDKYDPVPEKSPVIVTLEGLPGVPAVIEEPSAVRPLKVDDELGRSASTVTQLAPSVNVPAVKLIVPLLLNEVPLMETSLVPPADAPEFTTTLLKFFAPVPEMVVFPPNVVVAVPLPAFNDPVP